MVTKLLTAKNAQVMTAAVSIQTLKIEGRQVTLSLFRQILQEDILDRKNLLLKGVGWGHVRYQIEGDHNRSIHLIWQRGDELRRCILDRKENPPTFSYERSKSKPVSCVYGNSYSATSDWAWTRRPGDLALDCAMFKDSESWNRQQASNDEILIAYKSSVMAAIDKEYHEIVDWCNRRNNLVTPLFDLPQLFIAT